MKEVYMSCLNTTGCMTSKLCELCCSPYFSSLCWGSLYSNVFHFWL